MPKGSASGRRSPCGSQVQHCPAIKAACARANETSPCLSSLTSRAFGVLEVATGQADSQPVWTHSRSSGCVGGEVNAEITGRTCPRLPGNKRHHIPLEPGKPVCQGPAAQIPLLVTLAGPTFPWAPQMAPLSVRFLPTAALGCSLAPGWSACFSEKPKAPADLPRQRLGEGPASRPTRQQWHLLQASSALGAACPPPALRCHSQSRAAMGWRDSDPGRPMPSPEGKALSGCLKAASVSSHWHTGAGV